MDSSLPKMEDPKKGHLPGQRHVLVLLMNVNRCQTWNDMQLKVTVTIPNNDFSRNTASQHCCDIVSNGCNIVPILERYVALKIVVANRLV